MNSGRSAQRPAHPKEVSDALRMGQLWRYHEVGGENCSAKLTELEGYMTIPLIYLWAVACTAFLLISAASTARTRMRHSGNDARWDFGTVTVILLLALIPPLGLYLAYLIRRHLDTIERSQQ